MIGHAVGDALGVPVEFSSRDFLKKNPVKEMTGFGTYDVPAGCWSDDTSMSICALDSLKNGTLNYRNIMNNFCAWLYKGDFTPTGVVFDAGNTCVSAINNYAKRFLSINNCGLSDDRSNGNGSLMRIHPFVLYAYYNGIDDDEKFIELISNASSLTHAHQCSIDGCIIYAYVLKELLNNPTKEAIYNGINISKDKIKLTYYHRLFSKDIAEINERDIKSGGYVVDTLEAALWCALTTNNYKDCVLKAVNLGSDTDTVAAIAGGIAGAIYGYNSIPYEWISTLKRKNYIEEMCENAYMNWR